MDFKDAEHDDRKEHDGTGPQSSVPVAYFGGKGLVADIVWAALGDVGHYVEAFCGSCAVLLARPDWDPARHVETVNDSDGQICNVWRSLQTDPDAVAKRCDWPVNHADLMCRKRVLNEQNGALLEKLCADDSYFDAKLAGYYIWAASCWIGHGLICPGSIPHLVTCGMGVHAKGKIPHLGDGGKGVHAKGQIPLLGNSGVGVHAKGQIPHLGNGGKGVHTKGQIPHLAHGGVGVHAKGQIPHLGNGGGKDVREPYTLNIYTWFRRLSERLRYVRVVCGDWSRVCGGNWQTVPGRPCGIFFDPPYSDAADRDKALYAVDSQTVAHDVREWCRTRAADPDYRIVLAGYYEEHESLLREGWTVYRWSAGGGYGHLAGSAESRGQRNRHREALFFSPHCRKPADRMSLFDGQ